VRLDIEFSFKEAKKELSRLLSKRTPQRLKARKRMIGGCLSENSRNDMKTYLRTASYQLNFPVLFRGFVLS